MLFVSKTKIQIRLLPPKRKRSKTRARKQEKNRITLMFIVGVICLLILDKNQKLLSNYSRFPQMGNNWPRMERPILILSLSLSSDINYVSSGHKMLRSQEHLVYTFASFPPPPPSFSHSPLSYFPLVSLFPSPSLSILPWFLFRPSYEGL